MLSKKPIAISINFDSLNESYGFPDGYKDPSFFEGADRLLSIADRYQFPLSIYVIGRDLTNPEIFSRVRAWSQAGHEIGNHSWEHLVNLGSLKKEDIRSDIGRTHDLIAECIGFEPVGFTAPAWATSSSMVEVLIEFGYLYDASVFTSIMLYPAVFRNFLHHISAPKKMLPIINRPDWLGTIFRPNRPYFTNKFFKKIPAPTSESLLILPLPAVNRFNPCIWHTIGFILGWPFVFKHMKHLLRIHEGYYYLLHPADFLGPDDVDESYNQLLYRMNIPLQEKMNRLEAVFELLSTSGRPVKTMQKLATSIINSTLC